jgi:Transposase DDE domain
VARLLGRFHAGTGVLLQRVVAPLLTHELARVQAVHPRVQPGDRLVADRGLGSYAPRALLVQAGVHAVRRVGARPIVDFTPGRPGVRPSVRRTSAVKGVPRSRWRTAFGVHDPRVAWLQPTTCPSWLTREALAAWPETLGLREVRYRLGTPGCRTRQMTLVTTLLSPEGSSVADLAELYRQRWQVETALAPLKTTMKREVLHCKTVPGVLKALTVFAIVDNLVRRVMRQAATLPHTAVERISFLDALRWLSAPHTGMPLMAFVVIPVRPHRVEPRVKKRRPNSFPLMIKPRQAWRHQLIQQELRG